MSCVCCVRACFLLTVHPTLRLVYCKNYELAVQTMVRCKENPHFAEFLQEREFTPEAKGLDLGAFLIMPIQVPFPCLSPPPATLTFSCCCCDPPLQRIPRYVLLLKDFLKFTPKRHPGASTSRRDAGLRVWLTIAPVGVVCRLCRYQQSAGRVSRGGGTRE